MNWSMAISPFTKSYEEFASYPENLAHKSTYIGGLRSYKSRLDDVQSKVFTSKDANINVPFRDLVPSEDGMLVLDIYEVEDSNCAQHSRSRRCAMMMSSKNGWATSQRPTR